MNNGLITDSAKNQLFFCGSIVHKDITAVELDIDLEKKVVSYQLYLPKKTLDKVNKYNHLSKRTDLIGLWRFRRILKKEGNLNFTGILNKFVKDFCGSKWSVKVQVLDHEKYDDKSTNPTGDGWEYNSTLN